MPSSPVVPCVRDVHDSAGLLVVGEALVLGVIAAVITFGGVAQFTQLVLKAEVERLTAFLPAAEPHAVQHAGHVPQRMDHVTLESGASVVRGRAKQERKGSGLCADRERDRKDSSGRTDNCDELYIYELYQRSHHSRIANCDQGVANATEFVVGDSTVDSSRLPASKTAAA